MHNLISRLGLPECSSVLNAPSRFYKFHREELVTHTLTKLAHGLTRTVMEKMVIEFVSNLLMLLY